MQHVHNVRVAVRNDGVFGRFMIQIAQLAGQHFGLGLHAAQFVEDAQALLEDGLAAHRQPVLRQVADRHALLPRYLAVVKRFHAS